MRKYDYLILADILKSKLEFARKFGMTDFVVQFEALAHQLSQRLSVDRAKFLKACGIDP